MKWLWILALTVSSSVFASGTPTVPCWVNGDYQGSMVITKCWDIGGLPNKKRSLEN